MASTSSGWPAAKRSMVASSRPGVRRAAAGARRAERFSVPDMAWARWERMGSGRAGSRRVADAGGFLLETGPGHACLLLSENKSSFERYELIGLAHNCVVPTKPAPR